MKIGIDAREFRAGRMTGIGRYLLQFLEYGLADKNEFILFCNQNTWIPIEHPNVRRVIIPEYLTVLWDQVFLPLYVLREKPDVFLTPYFKAPIFAPCKLVVIINDLIPIKIQDSRFKIQDSKFKIQNLLGRLYFWLLGKMAAKRANRIITISNHSKKDIMEVFRVAEEKIEVVYLGVDKRYHPVESNLKEVTSKYGIDKRYVLYIGNLSPHKNVKSLIIAYSKLPDNIKDEYNLVIGGRKDRNYLDLYKLIKNLDLEDKVIFTNFIEDDDLPSIYSGAEAFVFPSLYEGFGLPPLEAMACGVPVIAGNVSSIPEVVGDAGILVNPEDTEEISSAMIRVLTDDNLRESMVERGLARAKQFTPEKVAKGFLRIIGEVKGPG